MKKKNNWWKWLLLLLLLLIVFFALKYGVGFNIGNPPGNGTSTTTTMPWLTTTTTTLPGSTTTTTSPYDGDPVLYCEASWPTPHSQSDCSLRSGCPKLQNCIYIDGGIMGVDRCECMYPWEIPTTTTTPPPPDNYACCRHTDDYGGTYIYGCFNYECPSGSDFLYLTGADPNYCYDICIPDCQTYCIDNDYEHWAYIPDNDECVNHVEDSCPANNKVSMGTDCCCWSCWVDGWQ